MSKTKNFVFFATIKNLDEYIDTYRVMLDTLRNKGAVAIDAWLVDAYPHSEADMEERISSLTEDTHSQLAKAEFAVAEFSNKSRTVIFQAILAIEKKVPLLCLVDEKYKEHIPSIITHNRSALVTVIEYSSPRDLRASLKAYLEESTPIKRRFNIMLNVRTLKELEHLSSKLDMPKSEIIRMLISKEYKKISED